MLEARQTLVKDSRHISTLRIILDENKRINAEFHSFNVGKVKNHFRLSFRKPWYPQHSREKCFVQFPKGSERHCPSE
ncbi:hypothetical protein CEXT_578931 [Caerostris extrusa]|uniref:Uncharacterized protein n=1 Tax=Caerostris extrusa TaxID=172846 RepID=A0AAV4P401_CAEEX|nr:hypothetical protein CEXT_578931 [Caerostris extrusa]